MNNFLIKIKKLDWFSWLVFVFFTILIIANTLYIKVDTDPFMFVTEEKASTDVARSLVSYGSVDTGGHYYQTLRVMPLANLIAYPFFKIFGLGIAQARLPYGLMIVAVLILFYFLIKKISERTIALFTTMLFALYPEFAIPTRTSLNENLFVILMIPTLYFFYRLTNGLKKWQVPFFLGLIIGLNILVKINGLAIAGFSAFYILFWLIFTNSFNKKEKIKTISYFGSGFIICVLLKQLIAFWANKELGTLGLGIEQLQLGFYNTDPLGVISSWSKNPSSPLSTIIPVLFKSQNAMNYLAMLSVSFLVINLFVKRRLLIALDYFVFFILIFNLLFISSLGQQWMIKRTIVIYPFFIYFIARAMAILFAEIKESKIKKKIYRSFILTLAFIALTLFFSKNIIHFLHLESIFDWVKKDLKPLASLLGVSLTSLLILSFIGKFYKQIWLARLRVIILAAFSVSLFIFISYVPDNYLKWVFSSQLSFLREMIFILSLLAILSYLLFFVIKKTGLIIFPFVLLLFFIFYSIFDSINTDREFIFKSINKLAFDSQQTTAEFKQFWGTRNYQLWGEESTERILTYATPVRINFYEDTTQSNWEKIYNEAIDTKEARFFVFTMYHRANYDNEIAILSRLKKQYPNAKIVEQFVSTWHGRVFVYILIDKYPEKPL